MDQQTLKQLLHYCPNCGVFTRKVATKKHPVGSVAGSLLNKHGYIYIRVAGKDYLAHRLAWLYMTGNWPTKLIDHIDRNPGNNRFSNLREVSNQQNQFNTAARGYYWDKQNKKWRAYIKINGVSMYIGLYNTEADARAAYQAAKAVYHRI